MTTLATNILIDAANFLETVPAINNVTLCPANQKLLIVYYSKDRHEAFEKEILQCLGDRVTQRYGTLTDYDINLTLKPIEKDILEMFKGIMNHMNDMDSSYFGRLHKYKALEYHVEVISKACGV